MRKLAVLLIAVGVLWLIVAVSKDGVRAAYTSIGQAQAQATGIIDGQVNAELIPDHVAYEALLRFYGPQPQQEDEALKQIRIKASAEEAGLDDSHLNNLMAVSAGFVEQVGVLDRQVAEIKDREWPDPSPEVMEQLTELQRQKEALIAEAVASLPTRLGRDGVTKLRKHIHDRVKHKITISAVPHPLKSHRGHHPSVGLAMLTFLGLKSYAAPAAQMYGGINNYTTASTSGSYVVGYSQQTESYNSYAHTHRTTSSVRSPDGRSTSTTSNGGSFQSAPVSTTTYMSIIWDGIEIEGTYSIEGRGAVFCRYAPVIISLAVAYRTIFVESQPRIDSITPDRGLIGNFIDVTITGANLDRVTSVDAGSGISVAINSVTSAQISARFNVDINAPEGNHGVFAVTSTGGRSNGGNFFVQIPSKLVLQTTGPLQTPVDSDVRDLGGNLVATNRCGVYRNYGFILVDQRTPGQRIFEPFTVIEEFGSYNGPFGAPTATPGNIGAGSLVPDLQSLTFLHPRCLRIGENESFLIGYTIRVGQRDFSLSTINTVERGDFSGQLKVELTNLTP